MKVLIWLIAAVFLLSACNKDKETIPVPEMQAVLLDLHFAQEKATDRTVGKLRINQDSLKVYSAAVLQHHNLSLLRFRNSLRHYEMDALMMDSLYSGMVDKVMKMKLPTEIKK